VKTDMASIQLKLFRFARRVDRLLHGLPIKEFSLRPRGIPSECNYFC